MRLLAQWSVTYLGFPPSVQSELQAAQGCPLTLQKSPLARVWGA